MPSKGHRTWRKLYPSDFTHETNHLSNDEVGILVRLECQYWSNGGPLTDDDIRLARCARVSVSEWPALKASLSPPFEWKDGLCIHPELDQALAEAKADYEKRSNAGKKGNDAKRVQRERNASAKRAQSAPESESDSSKEEVGVDAQKMAGYEQEFDQFWQAYPEKVARQKAFAAFVQVREDGIALERLLDSVERYKRTKPEKQSWCHPSTWLTDKRWTDGEEGSAMSKKASRPPDDVNRRKIYDLLGANDYRDWIESADVRDGEIIIVGDFQRDHVKDHFGNDLAKVGFKLTDGLEVPACLKR